MKYGNRMRAAAAHRAKYGMEADTIDWVTPGFV